MNTEHKHLTISISTVSVIKILAILLVVAFAWFIRDIVLLLFVAVIFAAIIDPIIDYLESKKIPRSAGVGIVYLVILFFLVLIVRIVIPPIAEQFSLLTANFPDLISRLVSGEQTSGATVPGNLQSVEQGLRSLQGSLQQAASGFYSFTVSVFRSFFNFLIVLAVTFYLTVQRNGLGRIFAAAVPEKYQAHLGALFAEIQEKIGGWARGQLLLGLIIGLLTYVCMLVFLPKYALVLAIVAGVTELIPYVGPIIGAVPAVFLGFTAEPISMVRGLAVLVVFIIIQQLENNFLVPQVMRRQVGLNPVVIIIAMLIGGRIAGILGMILAIPVATAISVVARDFLSKSNLAEIKSKFDKENKP